MRSSGAETKRGATWEVWKSSAQRVTCIIIFFDRSRILAVAVQLHLRVGNSDSLLHSFCLAAIQRARSTLLVIFRALRTCQLAAMTGKRVLQSPIELKRKGQSTLIC
jgi:hypothetical protein